MAESEKRRGRNTDISGVHWTDILSLLIVGLGAAFMGWAVVVISSRR